MRFQGDRQLDRVCWIKRSRVGHWHNRDNFPARNNLTSGNYGAGTIFATIFRALAVFSCP